MLENYCRHFIQFFKKQDSSLLHLTVVFVIFLGSFSLVLEADPDLFARVAVGRLIEAFGEVPLQDPFAYTPKNPVWYDHEWLAGCIFYWSSRIGGDLALFALKIGAAFLAIFFMFRILCRQKTEYIYRITWLIILLPGCAQVWNGNVRSRIFTYLFFSLLFLIFTASDKKKNYLRFLLLPAIFAVWCNLHGGFVVGLALTGLFGFVKIFTRPLQALGLFILLGLSVCATLINPYGLEYWNYVVDAVFYNRSGVAEWGAIPIYSIWALSLLILFGICLAGYFKAPKKYPLEAPAFLLFSYYLAFAHLRLAPIAFMVMICYWANAFQDMANWFHKQLPLFFRQLQLAMIIAFTCLSIYFTGMALLFVINFKSFSFTYDTYPVAALEWLRNNRPGGKVLTSFYAGSYALWRLYPKFKIAVDGRYEEVYPETTVRAAHIALRANHPRQKLAMKKVWPDYIVTATQPNQNKHDDLFGPQWHLIYQDPRFSIFDLEGNKEQKIGSAPTIIRDPWKPLF